MKFVDWQENGKAHVLELSRRNLTQLLTELDEGAPKFLVAPGGRIYVKGVEDDEHYTDREPGPMDNEGVMV